jgi:hypothetical protein
MASQSLPHTSRQWHHTRGALQQSWLLPARTELLSRVGKKDVQVSDLKKIFASSAPKGAGEC